MKMMRFVVIVLAYGALLALLVSYMSHPSSDIAHPTPTATAGSRP